MPRAANLLALRAKGTCGLTLRRLADMRKRFLKDN